LYSVVLAVFYGSIDIYINAIRIYLHCVVCSFR